MEWRQFVMQLGSLPPDRVEAIFTEHGAEAITLTDAADTPVLEPGPGETPLWDRVRITGLFPADADLGALREDLVRRLAVSPLPEWRVETLPDREWEREWLRDFHPMSFGRRLRVVPGDRPVPAGDAVILKLDPGLAFGTGTHPTTALCLEWLDGLRLDDARVLDFGCGSGILAIAALLLGARRAVALDIDPQALTATRANARRNGVDERIATAEAADPVGDVFDVVVANILAEPLKANAGTICSRIAPGGAIAMSGILDDQIADVAGAFEAWIDFEEPVLRGAWVRLTGTRR